MNGFKELKDTVIDKQLCCFCGTCIGVCPSEYIGYKDENIVNNDNKKCIDCKMCIKVCPGKDFDYMGMNEKLFNRTYCGSLTGGG
ncbi:MAG: 4Fe-4S dicluster domain-containing protein, partial [Mucispirillum sp.]|nr:4Fe-4S dicluster domain-containing protein [Mucispirillum sp.]